MVKSQSHVALVAVMHKYVQGDQSILMEDVIRYNRTHSVLDDQVRFCVCDDSARLTRV